MVLVYLKNLLFPHPPSSSPVTKPGHQPFFSPEFLTKYGTLSNGTHTNHEPSPPSTPLAHEPIHSHPETSATFLSPRLISDAIIGLSDGLTVPFALTAGLSTFNDTRVVVYGGLAELIAGSISMGLGGWLAARGEHEYYLSRLTSISQLIANHHNHQSSKPRAQSALPKLLHSIFTPYSVSRETLDPLITSLLSPSYPKEKLTSFILCFKHTLSPPDPHRATISALTIALGYFLGGFIPLLPYFFVGRTEVLKGLYFSVGVMGLCLFGFGWWKTSVVAQEEDDDRDLELDLEREEEEEEGQELEGRISIPRARDEEERIGFTQTGLPRQQDESGEEQLLARQTKSQKTFNLKHKLLGESSNMNWEQMRKNLIGGVQMVLVGGLAAGGAMGIVKLLGSMGG